MRIPSTAPPDVQQAFRDVWTQIDRVAGPANINLTGRRVINAGDAVDPFDYVTLKQLDEALDELDEPDEEDPLSLESVLYGTHAERLARAPGSVRLATIFYETDRAAIYQAQLSSGVAAWVLVMCRPLRTADALPSDLTADDAGFTWFDQTAGFTYRWSGGAWNYYLGSMVDTYANRPALALADRGFIFIASDYGYQAWRKDDSPNDWLLLEGVGGPMRNTFANRPAAAGLGTADTGLHFCTTDRGGATYRWSGTAWVWVRQDEPMRGTLSPDTKPTLGANDAGFLFMATDFDRIYRWDGTGWSDLESANQERFMIAFFINAPGGSGWAVCDGSTVTRSTSVAGTTNLTTPDLITNTVFLRGAAASGGTGTFAAAGADQDYYEALPYIRT